MHRLGNRILLAGALIALAACIAPARDRAQSPHVVTTPASVAARVDAAVVAVRSTVAGVAAPIAVDARGAVQTVVPPPAQSLPPHTSPAAVDPARSGSAA